MTEHEDTGTDRPLSEDEVAERVERGAGDQGNTPPDETREPAAIRETAARASGRDEDPEGTPA